MRQPRIVVVEDESIIAIDIQARLESFGYQVPGMANSGPEAIDLVAREQPDLVLMDIRLRGEMDGIQTTAEIRRHSDTPVVYLTAYADEHTLQRARATAAYGYLLKPFKPRELRATVEMALSKHELERNLRDSERRYRLLAENVSDLIWTVDRDLALGFCSPAMLTLLGYPPDGAQGMPLGDLFPQDTRESSLREIRRVQRSPLEDGISIQTEMLRRDGSRVWTETRVNPLPMTDGIPGQTMVGITRDISARRELEMHFRQAQKMEAVGRLAGGVAHDFNNILTAILGWSSFVQDALPSDSPILDDVAEIISASRKATGIVRQLLAFSRRQQSEPQIVWLNNVVDDLQRMLERLIGENIALETSLADDLYPVRADPTQLEQVLVNLIVNARDAIVGCGTIRLETCNVHIDGDAGQIPAGDYARLSVADDGQGMPSEVQERLFEPFFTTKALGEGTGLGLAVVFGVVEQSHGHIQVASEVGNGSRFDILLPRDLDPDQPPLEWVEQDATTGGAEVILVVEDEESVRQFAARTLRDSGYVVHEAQDGLDALVQIDQLGTGLDLILTDAVMPGMAGAELARAVELGANRPKVLLMSGYSQEIVSGDNGLLDGLPFLAKPFGPDTLARRVRSVLDG